MAHTKLTLVIRTVVTGVLIGISVANCEAPHTVKAVLIDQESSLHTSVGNRDVYRLRLMPQKGVPFDAIAIDNYPSYAAALPLNSGMKDVGFSIKLVRTPYCDQTSTQDGASITVRCFVIIRSGWKVPKTAGDDLWWK